MWSHLWPAALPAACLFSQLHHHVCVASGDGPLPHAPSLDAAAAAAVAAALAHLPGDRIGEAMASAGASVTVSCITNIIAFAVGAYTSLEALYSFSVYASVGFAFIFIYQVQ